MAAIPTSTLAELYLRQGLTGRAREIFSRLAEGDDAQVAGAARARLRELGPSATDGVALLEDLLARVQSRRRARG